MRDCIMSSWATVLARRFWICPTVLSYLIIFDFFVELCHLCSLLCIWYSNYKLNDMVLTLLLICVWVKHSYYKMSFIYDICIHNTLLYLYANIYIHIIYNIKYDFRYYNLCYISYCCILSCSIFDVMYYFTLYLMWYFMFQWKCISYITVL
jgi:hypothetical protein